MIILYIAAAQHMDTAIILAVNIPLGSSFERSNTIWQISAAAIRVNTADKTAAVAHSGNVIFTAYLSMRARIIMAAQTSHRERTVYLRILFLFISDLPAFQNLLYIRCYGYLFDGRISCRVQRRDKRAINIIYRDISGVRLQGSALWLFKAGIPIFPNFGWIYTLVVFLLLYADETVSPAN